jgi:hypothetical protein
MVGSLGGAFVLLAVVLLVAVALSVLVILVTAAGRDDDPVVAAADGPGLLARRDGGARARRRFERAEQVVLRGVQVVAPRRAREVPEAAAPAAAAPAAAVTPAPGLPRAVLERPARSAAPGTSPVPARPATSDRGTPAARPAVAPATGGAPSRVDLTSVDLTAVELGAGDLGAAERRERAEVDLRAPTALPGVARGSGEQGAGDQVQPGATGRGAGRGWAGRRPQLPPVVHRATERLVARVFDPFGSPDGVDGSGGSDGSDGAGRPAPATAGPAQVAPAAARSVQGSVPLRSAGPR